MNDDRECLFSIESFEEPCWERFEILAVIYVWCEVVPGWLCGVRMSFYGY